MRRFLSSIFALAFLASCSEVDLSCQGASECNDGDACTDDACTAGACTHTAVSVDDGFGCTTDACDPQAGITHSPNDGFCNDNQACTTADVCDPADPGSDAQTGCAFTLDEASCDDFVGCTDDACEPFTGCLNVANNNNCNANASCDPINDCTVELVPIITQISPNNSLAAAETPGVVIAGDSFEVGAQVSLAGVQVPVASCDYSGVPSTIVCTAPPNGAVIRGDVQVVNSGGGTGILQNGWTYTGANNETNGPGEADFCNLQFPAATTVTAGQSTELIFGRLFEAGLTNTSDGSPSITAELGFGPLGTDPRAETAWRFFPAIFNVPAGLDGNDDEFKATLAAPAVNAQTLFTYTYRFSLDGGLEFSYCDLDGAGSNGGQDFSAALLGTMTVNP
jgi:hypothetical protein